MAGIENLKNRILNDAKKEAEEIVQSALAHAAEIKGNAEENARKITDDIRKKAVTDGNSRAERIIAMAHHDARNSELTAKQEMIDKAFDAAIKNVEEMDSGSYTDFIMNLLLMNAETGNEEIIMSEKDRNRIKPQLLMDVNKKLEEKNMKGMLSFSSEKADIPAGFIMKRDGVEVNCLISSLVMALRESLENEIANLLFEDM